MRKLKYLSLLALVSLLLAVSLSAAEIPPLTSDSVIFVAYQAGAGGDDANAGLTPDAPRKTLSKSLELLPAAGGTVVVKNKLFIGGDYTIAARSGAVYITSNYDGVDYTDTALSGADANGLSNNVMKMAPGATLTFAGDTVLDNLILYNEYAKYNTLRVAAGATLVVGENVYCPENADLSSPIYMALEVEAGATAILNSGIFSSITGEGTCINIGAEIINRPVENSDTVVYIDYAAGKDTNTGLTPDAAKKTMNMGSTTGAAALLKENGGTLVAKGKIFLGASCTLPFCKKTVRITSNDGQKNWMNAEPVNNPSTALKMAAGATLTLQSDVVMDDLILFNEYEKNNTIKVTNGATLVIGKNVYCETNQNLPTPAYMYIVVEKGSTVILDGGIFQNVTGEGRILNYGAEILDHTHEKNAGLTTTEATCTETGVIEYACKVCNRKMGEDVLAKTAHRFGDWAVTTPADLGVVGEESRSCADCGTAETRDIPALQAKLTPAGITAATYADGTATIRYIVKLEAAPGAALENYGVFIAQNADGMHVKYATLTKAPENGEISFAVDLVGIPKAHLDTAVYAWAFVNLTGEDGQIALPLSTVTVSGVLHEMGV